MTMNALFVEHFAPAEGARVKVADVRRALGSQDSPESNGRNFRQWLAHILDDIPVVTQTIGGRAWLVGYRPRPTHEERDVHATPLPPPMPDVISIDRSNEILQALQRLTPEQVGPVAPQIVTVAAEVQRVLHEVHAQADALRGALTNLALEHDRWTTDPQTFLRQLVGDRTDVFVRQDSKPFYTMEPHGRRKFWAVLPPEGRPR